MEVRINSKKGTKVSGLDPVLAEIQDRLLAQPREWLEKLAQHPGQLANLEQEIHRTFAQLADRLVAGLLSRGDRRAEFR